MRLDKYSYPIFTEADLVQALYKGHEFSSDDLYFVEEKTPSLTILQEISDVKFFEPILSPTLTVEDTDIACQERWHMPVEYQQMDIEGFLVNQCPKENYQRLIDELDAFKERNMLDLLRWLKYFVDTCNKEGIVWGVGRGSSVASYILYLIGVHSIDPIKYNLDWQEFLR